MKSSRSSPTKIRSAIVGLGRIASQLETDALREKPCTHAGAIASHPQTVLIGGADPNAQARAAFKKQWDIPYVYPTLRALLTEQSVDILHIAAETKAHFQLLTLAKAHGVPVIVLEKPVTQTLHQAYTFLNDYRTTGLGKRGLGSTPLSQIVINHERRFAKDYRLVKAALASGAYGELVSVQGCLASKGPLNALNLLLHDGTHLIDALFYFLEQDYELCFKTRLRMFKKWGKVMLPFKRVGEDYVQASRTRFHLGPAGMHKSSAYGETLTCYFQYTEGRRSSLPVTLEIGSGREYFHFEITLQCTRGRIRIGNGILNLEQTQPSPYYENFHSLKSTTQRPLKQTAPFANMMKEAVSLFRGEQPVSVSSFLSGIMPLVLKAEIERVLKRKHP